MNASQTFFFYDLETSGFSPRRDRIMQFAGQRTDANFREIGQPVNVLIKLAEDILPSPEAILVTKITPQKTREDGLSEAEFAKVFTEEIATAGTIFVGYNNVRFDDEFMRNFLWRNFRDPYEWAWKEGNSRWDLLDVVRLVRALRPEGINWPFREVREKPDNVILREVAGSSKKMDSATDKSAQNDEFVKILTNNLESLAEANGFANPHAHDALSDVQTLIGVAKLLKAKQPKIFDFLLNLRDKNAVAKIVNSDTPFVYASGRYSSEFEKTTVVANLGAAAKPSAILVWDLRFSPDDFAKLTEEEILAKLTADYETRNREDFVPLPVKELCLNKCPAVAPLGTLDNASQKRIKLELKTINTNFAKLQKTQDLVDKIAAAFAKKQESFREKNSASNRHPELVSGSSKNESRSDASSDWIPGQARNDNDVEDKLYDSFSPDADKPKIRAIAAADAQELADFHPEFRDERLPELLLRFKARNFAKSLSADEKIIYESYRAAKLAKELPRYLQTLGWLGAISRNETPNFASDAEKADFDRLVSRTTEREIDHFILEELQLWAESIVPAED